MKILHVTNYLPGHHKICGGAEQAAYRQIMALQEHGVDNVVVTLREDFSKPEDFRHYQLNTIETHLGDWAGNSVKLKKAINLINQTILYYDLTPKKGFKQIIKQERPDLITFYNFNRLSFSLLSAAQDFSLPCTLTVYDYWYFCPNETLLTNNNQLCDRFQGRHCTSCYHFPRLNFMLCWLLLFRKPLIDAFLKKFDAFLVLSLSSKQLLERYGIPSPKIKIIHQFYRPLEVNKVGSYKPNGRGNYILFAGWLNHKKGLHVLVSAMERICAEIKDIKLLVLGMEADRKYLNGVKDYIARNGLSQNIEFLGKVDSTEFGDYLNNAKVLVVPEQWENMSPVIVMEAMAAGIPIVASRIGGISEFVFDGENGFLAQHDAHDDFADKIINLLSNPSLWVKISHKTQKLYQKLFDRKANLEKLLTVYKHVLVS